MKRWLAITLTSLLLILFIYPSAFIYPRDTLPDNNDTRLIAYIIGQVQNNLLSGQSLYYGTFFAPDQNTLAYSDLFLTSAVLTLPFRLVTSSPIVIFNIALILGFLLTILSSFLLFEYLFKNIWITSLAVLLFNFTVTAQMAESIFPVYLIFFACLIVISTDLPAVAGVEKSHSTNMRSFHSLRSVKMTKHSLPFIPLWIFLLFPYYQLHTSLPEATRSIRDAAHFSLGLDQIFTQFHGWIVIILVIASFVFKAWQSIQINSLFPGSPRLPAGRQVAFTLLAMTKLRGPKLNIFNPWIYIFYFSIIMSLGPVLKIFGTNLRIFGLPIPLPYALFYYLFPGFTGFRTPSRFIVLALLAAVILIGFQIKPLFAKLKNRTKVIFLLLILSLLFMEADLPLKGYSVNIKMHPVYLEVKKLPPEAVILELPIKLWNMPDHEIESIRSLYSLEHNHRRFGGFSGFATNSWIDLVEKINANGLNSENTSRLKSLGITHIIKNNHLYNLQGLSL
ncbi:MAG: hypothetical protein UW84_C0022G0014 [Candidatus Collierbacteria bacterium GW2011_GWA2_44_99]|uniref:Glycosyltransferase RgtA/B/C/D-like domain-containing protein n=1 Tax=Candidatus Collierbacteria bacterium GW2011_GWA2_44_99 TaxID=1618380 RepID=A0A0G1MYC6_9BACT|nr:MAG: hypothetical protein UW84_C0022G0014 [Candidatus Collierbacteria bacterium GW2011_GWA2_44_99]